MIVHDEEGPNLDKEGKLENDHEDTSSEDEVVSDDKADRNRSKQYPENDGKWTKKCEDRVGLANDEVDVGWIQNNIILIQFFIMFLFIFLCVLVQIYNLEVCTLNCN